LIYLLRHGETVFNKEGRIQGGMESDLNALGERQAAGMAERLAVLTAADPGPWRLVSSPLRRAQQTAAIVGARLGLTIEIDTRLREVSLGQWEGRLRCDVAKETPKRFEAGDWYFCGPGGETYEQVMARAQSWLNDLPPEPQRRIIVVSHGVTGRMLRGTYSGLTRAAINAQDVPQDALFRLSGGALERFACVVVS